MSIQEEISGQTRTPEKTYGFEKDVYFSIRLGNAGRPCVSLSCWMGSKPRGLLR